MLLRNQRPEHEERRRGAVADPEEDDRRPDPGLPPELVPSLPQLGKERLGLDVVGARAERDPPKEPGTDEERGGVEEQRRAGTAGGHEHGADRRAEHTEER